MVSPAARLSDRQLRKPGTDSLAEVADNTYRDGSSELNNTEQSFVMDGGVSVDQRKMNAVRAYFEWSEYIISPDPVGAGPC